MTLTRPKLGLALVAIVCLAAVGVALVSQHVFGMEPCPWCVLQRVIFLAIALVCVIGLAGRAAMVHVITGGLVVLLALSGAASALWQHFVAAHSTSCNLTLADRIVTTLMLDELVPDVFSARASCADAAVTLLGLPYEFHSLALFVAMAAAGAFIARAAVIRTPT